jgi:hypothetical protein
MKRFVSIGLTVLFVFLQIFVSAQAADHWPLNAKLKYFYNSAGEPTGAASAFGSAVASWNTSISCFSFETGTMGAINWITDKSTWDAIPNSTKKAGGITGTDYSTSFFIYFNSAYFASTDWSTTSPCEVGKLDVKSISLHELGHVLGLGECSGCTNTVMKEFNIYNDCWSGPFSTDKSTVNSFCGAPPAASVEAFAPTLMNGGVMIRADFGQLRGSKALWVNRQDGSLVGDTISVKELDGHTFELFDPLGTFTNRYFLYERDHRGVFLRAQEGVFENEPSIARGGNESDPIEVERALLNLFGSREAALDAASGLIVCPDSFVTSSQILANFWSTRGRSVSVVPLSQTGHSRDEIKSYLADAYSDGLRYALLAGCASDYEWFDDPSKWPDYPGDNDWYYWYQDYHTPGGQFYWVSHPERNLIPTWYFADTLYDNLSYWTPYYSGDWYYGDGLPELRIGRLPAANNSQLLAMIAKDIDYSQNKSGLPWQHDIGIWGFCQSLDGNNGPLMKAIVQGFIETIPASYQKHSLIDTSWTYSQREAQGVADWNAGRGTIWMQGTSSTAYKVNHFFSKAAGWHIGKLDAGKLTLLVGANCGIGAYDLALNPTYGEPVAQDLLGSSSNRGAWGLIAPSRGTWIEGDRQMCYSLNKYFSLQPVEDIGTAFMLAQREVRRGNEHQCAESFNLLGDPMAPVPTQETTEVQEPTPNQTRLRFYPNPFNPSVTIEYNVPQSCLVDLTIYNVVGQRVSCLVNEIQDEGVHSLIWGGVDQEGRKVSSGVYFCRLQVGAHRELRKVVLLR